MIAFRCSRVVIPSNSKDSRECCITMGNIALLASTFSMFSDTSQYYNHSVSIADYIRQKYNTANITEDMYRNTNIYIGRNVTNYAGMYHGCDNFNTYVDISNATNLFATFSSTAYNQPLISPSSGCKSCSDMFSNSAYNQPVNIVLNGAECDRMFVECHNFNQPVNISGINGSATAMFMYCENFNSAVTLSNFNGTAAYLMSETSNFNSTITISGNISSISGILSNCVNFNSTLNIVTDTSCAVDSAYDNCRNFNSPAIIPNLNTSGTASLRNLFRNCVNFNSSVRSAQAQFIASSTATFRYDYAFCDCQSLNGPVFNNQALINSVQIPYGKNIASMKGMFQNCRLYNQITILPGTNVNCNCDFMFYGCNRMNSTIVFPNRANNLVQAMYGVDVNFNADVYIPGDYRIINVWSMFEGLSSYPNRNIRLHFKSALDSQFNKTSSSTSLIGKSISWSYMQGGYYNSEFHIYCYNNYTG